MKKASVNWTFPDDRPVRPRTPIPPLSVGGLLPPTLGTGPRCVLHIPEAHPYPIPPPRPPPRSLQPMVEVHSYPPGASKKLAVGQTESRNPASLVQPTSTPPEICRVSRTRFQTSLQHWHLAKLQYEQWLKDLLESIGSASQVWKEFGQHRTFSVVVTQLLSHIGPSTLDLYSRAVDVTITWMKHIGVQWQDMSLQHLVDILSLAKDAAKHDVKAVCLQPMHIIRGLRWLVKTALMEALDNILNNALIVSFAKGQNQPRDRKEAVPIPLAILVNWELHVTNPTTPDWVRLLLGGFLLAVWASLRFADLQRINVASMNLALGSLRGVCRMTKTTRSGQPFAIGTAGFTGESPQSTWVYTWLKSLQAAVYRSYPFCPDFIIPVLDSYNSPTGNAPLSYAAALKALRWAAQTPWGKPSLSPEAAQTLTLHSLKVTFLSAAAQLRLPESARKLQGHHTGGSMQLYSRDDTIEALWLQSQVASAVRSGWRAVRPLARGGQSPLPEPPILMELSPLPKPFEMPLEDSLEMFLEGSNNLEPIEVTDGSSSSSDSSSDESSESGPETQKPLRDIPQEILFAQNGPAGCCHALTPAPADLASSKIFAFRDQGWSARCGASLRSSAIQIDIDMIQWPCRRAACRAMFDQIRQQP